MSKASDGPLDFSKLNKAVADSVSKQKSDGGPVRMPFIDYLGWRTLIVPAEEPPWVGNPIPRLLDIEAKTNTRLKDGENPIWFLRLYRHFMDEPGDVTFYEFCKRLHHDKVETLRKPKKEENDGERNARHRVSNFLSEQQITPSEMLEFMRRRSYNAISRADAKLILAYKEIELLSGGFDIATLILDLVDHPPMTTQSSATAPGQHLDECDPIEESGQRNVKASQPPVDVEPPKAEAPPETKPTAFSGGEMEFYDDDVLLCGVSICGGAHSQTRRKILDALRERSRDGRFVAYSSEQLTEKAELNRGSGSVAGAIRDLRTHIVKCLRDQANIECGRDDVILSGGRGYRFSESINLSVQEGNHSDTGPITDIDEGGDVRNVRNDDVRNVPDDAGKRRAWILQKLADGHRLQAPEVENEFNCSLKTAQRDLQSLSAEGLVEFVGPSRTGFYRLREPSEPDQ